MDEPPPEDHIPDPRMWPQPSPGVVPAALPAPALSAHDPDWRPNYAGDPAQPYSWGPSTTAPPAPYSWQPAPTPAAPPARTSKKRGGVVGAIVSAVAAFAKYALLLAKFSKFGLTFISMAISVVVMIAIFGPVYGIGIVALIAVHEMGHMAFAWYEKVPVSTPIFIVFGAVITVKRKLDPKTMAVIAIGGPIVGTTAAIALWLYAQSLPVSQTQAVLFALAYTGCFINLFNLIPFAFLDGGRVTAALSPWSMLVGLAVMAGFMFWEYTTPAGLSPITALIFLIGAIYTWPRFRAMRRGQLPPLPPAKVRMAIGAAYIVVVLVAAAGMSEAHLALVNGGYIPSGDSFL